MRLIRTRHTLLLLLDAALLTCAPALLYVLRFEGWDIPPVHRMTAMLFTAVSVPVTLLVAMRFGLYRRLWRYAGLTELEVLALASMIAALLCAVAGGVLFTRLGVTPVRVPYSILFTHALLLGAILCGPRLLRRIGTRYHMGAGRRRSDQRRVLIAGAGQAGLMTVRELQAQPGLGLEPIGFIDDDTLKHGLAIGGTPVLGSLADIPALVAQHRVSIVIIAMPSAPGTVVRRVVRAAIDAGIEARTIPSLGELLAGGPAAMGLREVRIEDLLRREPIETDCAAVARILSGRTVLVTGAGGSIGSELARQIAAAAPERLILLGHGENPVFEILNELSERHDCELVPVIADVRDRARIRKVFERYRPHVVFHAAAHKHVPLMEGNVYEAITNNVEGTRNVVQAALAAGTSHFVLISTDKAVRPTNVMGATKRLAECIVHNAAVQHNRNFVAVRFGNVLGSQGSVVPTFLRQIRRGGPVTVTHPEMRRYFMTIPEAVQLVLQAGALGRGGELFMLDMGEPVRIVDLARDMIRLCSPGGSDSIEIAFTGVRPGEKLTEELFFSHEVALPTDHPKILRARSGRETNGSDHAIDALIRLARSGVDAGRLRVALRQLVPDYRPAVEPMPTPTEMPLTVPAAADVLPMPRDRMPAPINDILLLNDGLEVDQPAANS